MTWQEAHGLRHGTPVEVRDGARWRRTIVDAHERADARCGWIMVAAVSGRAGPFAARVEDVRLLEQS